MGLVAAGFFLSRPSADVAALEASVRAATPEPTAPAAQRLREPLDRKHKELLKIQDNPDFARLPSSMQEEVQRTIQEINTYQELGKKVDGLKRVRFFKKEDEIAALTLEVDKIILPPAYAAEWADTRLAKKIQQYKNELAALAKALADEKNWLQKQAAEGDKLRRMTIPGEGSPERQAWINRADAFLKRKNMAHGVPGIPNMKLRELYEFPSVNRLREDYETVRARVDKIRGGLTNS
jgi:hypothetical protein